MVEFMMELHHESPKNDEASMEASPHGLLNLYELASGKLYKRK